MSPIDSSFLHIVHIAAKAAPGAKRAAAAKPAAARRGTKAIRASAAKPSGR
jgi:hypothetical protein